MKRLLRALVLLLLSPFIGILFMCIAIGDSFNILLNKPTYIRGFKLFGRKIT